MRASIIALYMQSQWWNDMPTSLTVTVLFSKDKYFVITTMLIYTGTYFCICM